MRLKPLLVVLSLGGSFTVPVAAANVRVDIVHHDGPREPPPPPREERYAARPGFVWVSGHHEWRRGRYLWRGGEYRRQRRGFEWNDGRWDRHEDHYDWHRGEWRPHR
jgi:hypothetical protein